MTLSALPSTLALTGRWALLATTYSFLADPRREHVELLYRSDPGGGFGDSPFVRQETRWRTDGREHRLTGVSRPLPSGSHRWRGRGLGFLITTEWTFALVPDGSMGVVGFAATLLSDAGFHVIARRDVAPKMVRERLDRDFGALGLPRAQLPSLRWRDAA